jgi:ABC-type sugar transport system permease subunit
MTGVRTRPRTGTRSRVDRWSATGARRSAPRSSRAAHYLFVLPLLVVFAGFYLWPAVSTVASSFFRWGLLNPWRVDAPSDWNFAGLDNYRQTMSSGDFWNAGLNTAVWLIVFPLLVTAFALAVSIMLWYTRVGTALLRSVFILPMTISLAATGVIWSFIYNPDPNVGVLNAILKGLHLPAQQWLSNLGTLNLGFADLKLVNLAVIMPAVWAFAGFGVITLTAGLTSVPDELIEAARVDGARPAQIVRHVIVPALRGPLTIVLVVSVIFALRTFDIVFVTTGGGPGRDTEVLALLLWQEAFAFIDSPQGGVAAAIAVLMSAVLIVAAIPYLRKLVRRPR